MSDEFEVCILGGGPAGATLAVRLARLGHQVAVVEQHRFPRPHIGESLTPAVWPLLKSIDAHERVATHGFIRAADARIRWRRREEERLRLGGAMTVDRGAFDAILLDHARAAGAAVIQPASARRPACTRDGWTVPVGDRLLRARFLADATGRRRLLGGRRTRTSPRTLALHAVWRGGPPAGAHTRIDALADAWLWGAHLPGGGFRAMAFVDPDMLVGAGRDRERLYRRLLAASPLFADLTAGAKLAGRVQACDATTYTVGTPVDMSSVKVGEAAFAIDPLSSCGVQTAIQSGLAAAAVVHSIVLPDGNSEAALRYYSEYQRHSVGRHAATAAALYAEHRPHADVPFWRRRSAGALSAPPPVSSGARLADLLPRRVRLARRTTVVDAPCLVGDRIELRRALVHPLLGRPVAFLGGTELAPLLDRLQDAPSLAHTVVEWDRSLPPGRAREIAAWLNRHGLIEIARL